MPTSPQHTFSNTNQVFPFFEAEEAHIMNVKLSPSLTLAKGTILGEVSATPGTYAAYASGNTNGTQTPKLILVQSVVTDASSNVTRAGEHGATVKHAPAYFPKGTFKTADLVGCDANAVNVLGAALVQGDLTTGLIRF
jgi:hypothetical protein